MTNRTCLSIELSVTNIFRLYLMPLQTLNKNYFIVVLFFFTCNLTKAQLNPEFQHLTERGYLIQDIGFCADNKLHFGRPCEVYPADRWFNSRIGYLNEQSQRYDSLPNIKDTIEISEMDQVQAFFVSKNETQLRAHVIKYSFHNPSSLAKLLSIVSQLTPRDRSILRKVPFGYIELNGSLYLILPDGPNPTNTLNNILSLLKN